MIGLNAHNVDGLIKELQEFRTEHGNMRVGLEQ
jgi:hypothetical protein